MTSSISAHNGSRSSAHGHGSNFASIQPIGQSSGPSTLNSTWGESEYWHRLTSIQDHLRAQIAIVSQVLQAERYLSARSVSRLRALSRSARTQSSNLSTTTGVHRSYRSAVDLLSVASLTLHDLAFHRRKPDRITARAYLTGLQLLPRLVFDNAPSIQIASNRDGGFECDWLVGKDSITIEVYDSGEAEVTCFDRIQRVAWSAELVGPDGRLDDASLSRIGNMLLAMSQRVKFRAGHAR